MSQSLLELMLGGVRKVVEIGRIGLGDYINGVKIVPLEDFSVEYLAKEVRALDNLSLYHKSQTATSSVYPSNHNEISEHGLSVGAVMSILSDKEVMIPAFNVQDPSAHKWVSFSEYKPELHRSDVFSVKRQERKNGRVSLRICVETSVRGIPLASYFRIEGFKVL